MVKGFQLVNFDNTSDSLLNYREKGALRGVYLGFAQLHEYYTLSLPGCTDLTGFPGSGKSEVLLELLLTTSIFYGWKHLLYVPDVGSKEEILSLLIHKKSGKTFDKRYVNSNYISEAEVMKEFQWLEQYFFIMVKEDLKSKMTPYEFWDYAAQLNHDTIGGIQTATIDSWKDMFHDWQKFGRDDKYLEDVLSYRNAMSEKHKMHFITIIHPTKTDKDKDGKRAAPTPYDLKGGSEWYNNGKCMITIHREDGSNKMSFRVTKAKPKSVAKLGAVDFWLDLHISRYYVYDDSNNKIYADKEYKETVSKQIESQGLNFDDPDDVPF